MEPKENLEQQMDRLEQNIFTFLMTDLDIALTLAHIALTSEDKEKRERNHDTAQRAYQKVNELREKAKLSDREYQQLDAKLDELASLLQRAGERREHKIA